MTLPLDQYLPHSTVLERWPWISTRRLAQYRRDGRVGYFPGARGEWVYRVTDLEQAVAGDVIRREPCVEMTAHSSTAANGSAASMAVHDGTDTGMTAEAEERAARALAPTTSSKPRIVSSGSSLPHHDERPRRIASS